MSKKEKKNNDKEKNSSAEKEEKKSVKKNSSIGKKILKITAWTLGSLFAFILLLVIFRDPVIKFGVTSIGSWITGVDITLEDLDTSLFKGSASIKGLRVGNPAGFDEPDMLVLENFNADIDVSSLFTKEIIIEDLTINGLVVTAEFNKRSKFNVTTLTGNLKKRFPPNPDEVEDAEEKSIETIEEDENEKTDSEDPTILLKNIDIAVRLSLVHDLSHATLAMPISYSRTDLRLEPNDDMPLVEQLDIIARKFEDFCQTCFNAGALVVSAGAEAGESLKSGVNSGIDTGKSIWNSATKLFKK